jgi:hypothetical protein
MARKKQPQALQPVSNLLARIKYDGELALTRACETFRALAAEPDIQPNDAAIARQIAFHLEDLYSRVMTGLTIVDSPQVDWLRSGRKSTLKASKSNPLTLAALRITLLPTGKAEMESAFKAWWSNQVHVLRSSAKVTARERSLSWDVWQQSWLSQYGVARERLATLVRMVDFLLAQVRRPRRPTVTEKHEWNTFDFHLDYYRSLLEPEHEDAKD